ncbi:hypothetical protein N7491_001921 [Penicillium cf. griseofulvum]|uniref:Uncharacterized protein n=1 Tax=Penicillium cf. griseofulvum TaxID=2972120 RepID=A0A9W9MTT4_9EURO|nr:hypothetical protein N7472_003897 [Penicillium cf. griseofulvum]KAJ5445839.1 hypothetical protein N7491_001921 [Penicillium cf. griseofulvum]
MPEMESVIFSHVQKQHSQELKDPLIEHLGYRSVIDAAGGEKVFTQMALNAIDPRVLALQGKIITVKIFSREKLTHARLDSTRASQTQELDPWPHSHGGYCDFITDSRDLKYWRGYVGQASALAIRIPQHCSAIRTWKNNTLHYHIVTKPSAAGYRYGNFIRLWIIQFPNCTQTSTKEAFENVLELSFTRAFQTLAPSILEIYFGPCPEGSYSSLGLNIISPLMQCRELSPRVRAECTKILEGSTDPEIREWPSLRAQQKLRPNASEKSLVETQRRPRFTAEENVNAIYAAIQCGRKELADMVFWPSEGTVPWTPLGREIQPLDVKAWFENISNWILNNGCAKSDLAIPIGTTAASIGIMLDSVPTHTYSEISLPWGL